MDIRLERQPSRDGCTLGTLSLNGQWVAFTLEDVMRDGPKIAHETAIPYGRYRVSITMSNRFKKMLPLVHDVPGFTGVRLHGGNTAEDTSGCILLGEYHTHSALSNCAPVLQHVQGLIASALAKHEDVWLLIVPAPTDETVQA